MNIAENIAEIQAFLDSYYQSQIEKLSEKIPLKITVSGKRACGKTMLIAKLKQFFEMQGCKINIVSESDDPRWYPRSIKNNQEKRCRWDLWDITIEEKAPEVDEEEIENGYETAREYIKKWNEK